MDAGADGGFHRRRVAAEFPPHYADALFRDPFARRLAGERGEPALSNLLVSDEQTANSNGLDGTPAFLLGRSGGALKQLEPGSFTEPDPFNKAIEELVKG